METNEDDCELSAEMKAVLDQRLQEDEETYMPADESISQLFQKYNL